MLNSKTYLPIFDHCPSLFVASNYSTNITALMISSKFFSSIHSRTFHNTPFSILRHPHSIHFAIFHVASIFHPIEGLALPFKPCQFFLNDLPSDKRNILFHKKMGSPHAFFLLFLIDRIWVSHFIERHIDM